MSHTKFRGSPLVPEKFFFKNFTIYRRGSHLGHATSIRLIHFSLYIKGYIQIRLKMAQWFLGKASLNFHT